MKLPLKLHHLPAILLLSAASLLVWKIATELEWIHPRNMPLPQQKLQNNHDTTLALQPESVRPPLKQSYNEIQARPTFIPDRRPIATLADTSLPPAMRKGQFILIGVILTKDSKIAMLNEIATNEVFVVEQGKEINGMQLENLESERITLKQGDEHEDLMLDIQPGEKRQQTVMALGNTIILDAQQSAIPPDEQQGAIPDPAELAPVRGAWQQAAMVSDYPIIPDEQQNANSLDEQQGAIPDPAELEPVR